MNSPFDTENKREIFAFRVYFIDWGYHLSFGRTFLVRESPQTRAIQRYMLSVIRGANHRYNIRPKFYGVDKQ